jgi:hypothetical protein
MPTAAIYIPPNQPLDGKYAREGMLHIVRHGYDLKMYVHDWDTIVDLVRERAIDVIIFPRRKHMLRSWSPRVEYIGEDPQRIVAGQTPRNQRSVAREGAGGRHRRPSRFTR